MHPLMEVARRSLEHGVRSGRPLAVDPADFPPELRSQRACFVTLRIAGALRGCIGAVEATVPLVNGVAESAFKAGFRDPRFPPLDAEELPRIDLEISVLTPPERVEVDSEASLLTTLRPGVDGVILKDGHHFATFLPAVWKELPDPEQFWRHLQRKAGLAPGHWSESLEVRRYTADVIS